jgi:hypothetical protein
MITGYRILTYLLLPFAAILGLLTILTLFASFANIAGLLPAFLCGATVIYLVVSFNFLHRSILSGQPSKPSQYDWIRVNGFVALFMGILFIFQSIYFRDKPELNEQLQIQMETMKADMPDGGQMPDLQKVVNWVLNFMLVTGLLLSMHVLATFSFLKKYAGSFRNS